MESAWPAWGAPSLPTCISGVGTERFDRLRGAVGLSAEISCGGARTTGVTGFGELQPETSDWYLRLSIVG